MIPFVDLKAQYNSIKEEIDAAIARVLESGQFVLGDEVAAFEEEFAAYCGGRYGIAVNSGTSALHLALLAAGVGPGDEVITVPLTFVATVAAICYTGAEPVFVDIQPRPYTIDVNQLEAAITERTKAILPVHLYGQPADMGPILEIARRYGLTVIEDAAQAHGAEYRGRRAGSIGDLGCFSFYPSKNLGAYGEGGMVVTNRPEYARRVGMLRDWGQEHKHHHVLKGYNYRMEAMQAAVLRVKLKYLDQWNVRRRKHGHLYSDLLPETDLILPMEMPYSHHVFHLYVVQSTRRDKLQQALVDGGIATAIHYPVPIHLQETYQYLEYGRGKFPVAESVSERILSLPLYPEMSEADVQAVLACVRRFKP